MTDPASPNAASRANLYALLDEIIAAPGRCDEVAERVEAAFTQRRAVMVLDMSGFSRTTQVHGIVAFLVMIRQMQRIAVPVVEACGGALLKAEADNLYCLFETADDAVAAAQGIMQRLVVANPDLQPERRLYASIGIGYGDILVLPGEDMFGDEVNLASKLGEDVAAEGSVLLTPAARAVLDPAVASRESKVSISGLVLSYHVLD